MSKPVCLVTGVGPEGGTGAETARRFGEGGYRVAMLARNADNLDALAGKYEDARAYPCDVADLDALVETVSRIRAEMGAPSVVVHNALRSARGGILELDPDDLEKNFRVNTTALLYLARETIPAMLEAGKGAILMTGNTSATRGGKNYGFFASTKAAQADTGGVHRPRIRAAGHPRCLFHHRRRDRNAAHPRGAGPRQSRRSCTASPTRTARLVLPRRTAPLRRRPGKAAGSRPGDATPPATLCDRPQPGFQRLTDRYGLDRQARRNTRGDRIEQFGGIGGAGLAVEDGQPGV